MWHVVINLATRLFAHDFRRLSNLKTPISLSLSFLHISYRSSLLFYLQLTELEQRVIEAEERAEEAEDKVSH